MRERIFFLYIGKIYCSSFRFSYVSSSKEISLCVSIIIAFVYINPFQFYAMLFSFCNINSIYKKKDCFAAKCQSIPRLENSIVFFVT